MGSAREAFRDVAGSGPRGVHQLIPGRRKQRKSRLDVFHQHNANGGLCLRGGEVVGGEEISRAECAQRGGHKTLLIDIWMLHAWVVPGFECTWGVFSGECPELGGRIGGTAYDPPAPN